MRAQPLAFKIYSDELCDAFISRGEVFAVPKGCSTEPPNSLAIAPNGASREDVLARLASLYEHASNVFYSHRFWTDLGDCRLAVPLFTGWLIESCHFVGSASVRMTQSLPRQPDSQFKQLLAVHAGEELDHARFFLKALRLLGYEENFVKRRKPLPETSALVTIARSFARQSPLAYAFVSGFLESTRDDEASKRLAETLIARGVSGDVLASAQEHERLDKDLGHRGLLEEIVEAYGLVGEREFAFACDCVLLFLDAMIDWLEGIRFEYSDDELLRYQAERFRRKPSTALPLEWPCFVGRLQTPDGPAGTLPGDGPSLPKGVTMRLQMMQRLTYTSWTEGQLLDLLVIDGHSLRDFLGALADAHAVWYANPLGALTRKGMRVGKTRLGTWKFIFGHWLEGIYGEDFWTWIQGSGRTDPEVIGWLFENYHYIRSARDHMGAAISQCPRSDWRDTLARHFAEELSHYLLFGRGLLASGISRNTLVRARPLPTTVALCAKLTELALSDTLAYVVADQMLQYSSTYAANTNDDFYERLASLHPELAPSIDAFFEHDRVDFDLNHNSMFDPILLEVNPLAVESQSAIRKAGELAMDFCLYLRGIKRWYGDRRWVVEDRLAAYSRDDQ